MGIKQIKIDVNELTVGMFVSGLDRPWTQTPFPLQGFYIRDLDEIKELKVHCNFVYIDVVKGSSPVKTSLRKLTAAKSGSGRRAARAARQTRIVDVAPLKIRRDAYREVEPLEKEIVRARELHQQVYNAVGAVMGHVNQDNHHVPINETKRVASSMVDSVLRSPDAFTWLSRVRDKDEYTYSHAVRSAVWGILFGRHIGLPKTDLDVLAMGVLLKDIGKTRLPKHLLEKKQRTDTEQQAYEKFIEYGVEILRKVPDVQPRVTSVVKTHCERVNGSGYPNHLRGDKIPLLGKIAGIVTFYDETVNPRGQSQPVSPSKAVAKLYEYREVEFQEELVVEFIRAIGLYPTGTLVELSTGEVGVVVEQNFERRLKPVIMVVLDAYKQALSSLELVDLAAQERDNQAKLDSGKYHPSEIQRIEILQDLQPGAYDIDVAGIRDKYIQRKQGRGLLGLFKRKGLRLPGL
ncbi:HD-GYP domain, c-di-GMP phosphodiesterase class II (or its inactivated variant) [Alteromonadaceae bacterium Bs31]|nr:HD-GYP domain, c-di-GMP phosphodiesterase class II (or its inactivated variant) [Alteromonadaceae bacterium Bs31]